MWQVGAIKELCQNSKNNQSLIAKAGGIGPLLKLVESVKYLPRSAPRP